MTQEPEKNKSERIVKVYDRPASADRPAPVVLIVGIVIAIIALLLVLHFGLHLF